MILSIDEYPIIPCPYGIDACHWPCTEHLLLAVARTLSGNVDGISGANYKKGMKKADDSLFSLCGQPAAGYPKRGTFPEKGFDRAGLFLIFDITEKKSAKEIAQLITVRVEEKSLITLCQSVLDGTADYSTDQFLDKLVSEAGKNDTTYKNLKSQLPKSGRPASGYHFWVYTLTEEDMKGDSLRGVIKSSDGNDIKPCIGSRGGRGRKDTFSFKNINAGKGNGREWKSNTNGNFWIEKLKAMPDEWYEEKGITIAPPLGTAVPLSDLDLADLESEEENENGNE